MSPEAPTYVCPENSGFKSLKRSLCLFWICGFWASFGADSRGKVSSLSAFHTTAPCELGKKFGYMSHNMSMSVRNSGFETQNTPKVCGIVKVQLYYRLLYSYSALPYMYLSSRLVLLSTITPYNSFISCHSRLEPFESPPL